MLSTAELRGRSFDDVRRMIERAAPAEVAALLFATLTVEPSLTPAEIALLTGIPRRSVLNDISAGKLGDYFARCDNQLAVPVSGVNAWRASFRVKVKNGR